MRRGKPGFRLREKLVKKPSLRPTFIFPACLYRVELSVVSTSLYLNRTCQKMAPPKCARTPTAEDAKSLKTTYDALLLVNERLREADCQVVRLMYLKYTWHGGDGADEEEVAKFRRQANKDPRCDILHAKDWLAWAGDRDLFNSLDPLNIELEKANASKSEHESIQAALRLSVNNLSRRYLRSLTILDLPDEILLEIFEALEGFNHDLDEVMRSPSWFRSNVKDIKNARLVCRRFCDLSSQLLVNFVVVTPTETSLERLDEISRHPTISKGVRDVQVVLRLHSHDLADFDDFVSYFAHHVGQNLKYFDNPTTCESWKITEQAAAETMAKGRKFEDMLSRLTLADADDPDPDDTDPEEDWRKALADDDDNFARVRDIHAEYKLILGQEQSLIQSGRFSRAIGEAIARMPPGRGLHVDDTIEDYSVDSLLLRPGVDILDTARSLMLRSLTGSTRIESGLDLPDYGFIVPLIDAVRGAGALVDSINLKLSCLGQGWGLVLDPTIRAQFSSGMQQLRRFSFELERDQEDPDPDRQDLIDNLHRFLSACVDTPSLEKLSVSSRNTDHLTDGIDVGEVMGSRSRPKLRHISLWHVSLDASKLRKMLKQPRELIRFLYLDDINLRNGTWEETLDALRGKGGAGYLCLKNPSGAECVDMSPDDYKDVFGTGDGWEREHNSKAEIYVNNPDSKWYSNPIRDLDEKRLASVD